MGEGTAQKSSRKHISRPYVNAPYVRSRVTTGDIMYVVVLALLPCAGVGMYYYGFHAALLIGISVGTAIAAELICDLIRRSGASIYDYSCVVTGLIGGLILPPGAPLWTAAAQSLLAIVVFKHLFGGLGRNLFNPAMAARFVLTVACYDVMTDYGTGRFTQDPPLTMLMNGETPDLVSMLTGNTSGCIGTSCTAAVLAAAVILLVTGIIDLYIPATAVVTFMVLYALFGDYGLSLYTQCVQICGGSFLFTVIIMAGDYTTSPVSKKARTAEGILLGVLILVFRQLGYVEEACMAALLIVNAFRPLLDAKLAPKPFGATAARWVVRAPKTRSARGTMDGGVPDVRTAAQGEFHALEGAAAPAEGAEDGPADPEFARLQEQILRRTQGLETDRYAGDAGAPAAPGADDDVEMEYEPWEEDETQQLSVQTIDELFEAGEYEAVVTDTSSIRPEAIRATIDEEGRVGGSWYAGTGKIPPMPTLPSFGPAPERRQAPMQNVRRNGDVHPADADSGPGGRKQADDSGDSGGGTQADDSVGRAQTDSRNDASEGPDPSRSE